jgi:hypothetical protein
METFERQGVEQFRGDSFLGNRRSCFRERKGGYEAVRFNAMKHGILSVWWCWRTRTAATLPICWRR